MVPLIHAEQYVLSVAYSGKYVRRRGRQEEQKATQYTLYLYPRTQKRMKAVETRPHHSLRSTP